MNWNDVLPKEVARRQRLWERYQQIERMRALGFEYEDIVRRVPDTISGSMWRVVTDSLSPVEKYLAELHDVRILASRHDHARLWDPSVQHTLVEHHRASLDGFNRIRQWRSPSRHVCFSPMEV